MLILLEKSQIRMLNYNHLSVWQQDVAEFAAKGLVLSVVLAGKWWSLQTEQIFVNHYCLHVIS